MKNKILFGKKKLVFGAITLMILICNIGIVKGFMPNLEKQEVGSLRFTIPTDQVIESQKYDMDLAGMVKSDIETKQLDAAYYLKQNPNLIDELSDLIEKKISAKPELLGDFEMLAEEIEFEITSHKLQSNIQTSSMEKMGLDWYDIIMYILKMFMPAKPGITIDYIVSQCESTTIRCTVDNADTVYGVTVVSDGKIIGYVGDGWFTWPGNSKTFTLSYTDIKCHKLEVYPTILHGIPEIRSIFTSSLSICISSGSYIILPEPETIEIQPTSVEIAPIQLETICINKIAPVSDNVIGSPIIEPIVVSLPLMTTYSQINPIDIALIKKE